MYDLSIPGWANEEQLKEIERLAKLVPKNGKIVEIGAYLGRSSFAWAKSCHPSVTVYFYSTLSLLRLLLQNTFH
ncbi:MAG: hypothetical protein ACTSQX_14360 [Candidatus Heimdallarchaeota archaeon]